MENTMKERKRVCDNFNKNHRYLATPHEILILDYSREQYSFCLRCGKKKGV